MSGVIAIICIGLAFVVYMPNRDKAEKLAGMLRPLHTLLRNKYYVDEFYDWLIVRRLRNLGQFCFGADNWFIDSILWLVTAVVRFPGWLISVIFQRGILQSYALMMLLGLAVIFYLALRSM